MLADRARSECARSMRALRITPATPGETESEEELKGSGHAWGRVSFGVARLGE